MSKEVRIVIGIGDGAEASHDVYKTYGPPKTENTRRIRPAKYCEKCGKVEVYGRQRFCVKCARYRKRVSTRNSVRKLRKRQKSVAA